MTTRSPASLKPLTERLEEAEQAIETLKANQKILTQVLMELISRN